MSRIGSKNEQVINDLLDMTADEFRVYSRGKKQPHGTMSFHDLSSAARMKGVEVYARVVVDKKVAQKTREGAAIGHELRRGFGSHGQAKQNWLPINYANTHFFNGAKKTDSNKMITIVLKPECDIEFCIFRMPLRFHFKIEGEQINTSVLREGPLVFEQKKYRNLSAELEGELVRDHIRPNSRVYPPGEEWSMMGVDNVLPASIRANYWVWVIHTVLHQLEAEDVLYTKDLGEDYTVLQAHPDIRVRLLAFLLPACKRNNWMELSQQAINNAGRGVQPELGI